MITYNGLHRDNFRMSNIITNVIKEINGCAFITWYTVAMSAKSTIDT